MSLTETQLINLSYGKEESFSCEVATENVAGYRSGPRATSRLQEKLLAKLQSPTDLPPLSQCLLPGDAIAIALEPHTPGATDLIAGIWSVLKDCGVAAENVVIVQSFNPEADGQPDDPRSLLPEDVRDLIKWKLYTPAKEDNCAYLAATTSGERIYLAREIIEADFVVTLGQIGFDPLIGISGTNSVFYPGLSTEEAFKKTLGQGHLELGPDDIRPLRQKVDEIGFLLGTLFSIQVIPAAGGGVYQVLAGQMDSVLRQGKELLTPHWLINLPQRPETIVLAIDEGTNGSGWERIGKALSTARRLVAKEGRIILLTTLSEPPQQGISLLQKTETPSKALKYLREELPRDFTAASQIAQAAEWAEIYLLSHLDNDLADDLFFIPLDNEADVTRLLSNSENCLYLGSAQNVCGMIE